MILNAPNPDATSLVAAIGWIKHLLQDQLAMAIAILAVAFLGYQMMSGRLSVNSAVRVALGSFILFGSSAIVKTLMSAARNGEYSSISMQVYQSAPAAGPPPIVIPTFTPPSNGANPFDPYTAGLQKN